MEEEKNIDKPGGLVPFSKLSNWGLIYQINTQILHPLGLSLTWDIEKDCSYGAIIDEHDFNWSYDEDAEYRNVPKFNHFIENRIPILQNFANEQHKEE